MDNFERHNQVVCVARGTGITHVLPIILQIAQSLRPFRAKFSVIWSIEETRGLKWVESELIVLQQTLKDTYLDINIFFTHGIAMKIASKRKELHPTDIRVKQASSVESSRATDSRARSLCLHQSDWINGNWCPDVANAQ
ncbi:hypothetical protein THAR02_08476 [Trichoderma harzianum]|uniref:Ferric reductase NAD binding domain-containing protein n=1 Tax=Trichoderma harzianum TaxID=5544 RepID=A0A0F9ZGH7_TRIHA|nr:hypothetical protein THAR02_08476 [Trichoderma harzianum]